MIILERPLVALMILCIVSLPVPGDEPATSRVEEANQRTTDAAKEYQFNLKNDPPGTLKFNPKSLLRWSNPVAGELYGNVFVWTHNGRPEVVGSFLQWYSPHTHGSYEMHSLSATTIEGRRNDVKVWEAEKNIQWHDFPALVVAETQRARKSQMRAAARRFSVEKEDREGEKRNLRMLTQPLFEYGDKDQTAIEGGLFVFAQGTDPEVFLLLEARKTPTSTKWQYAFARMNSVKFVAKLKDQPVWQVDIWPWSKARSGRDIYYHSGLIKR